MEVLYMAVFKSLFFDSEGTFLWAGIAAIVAAIGALVSLIFSFLGYKNTVSNLKQQELLSKAKIDADLKAKARIEWINQVRELTSIYISELSKLDLILENTIKISSFYVANQEGLNSPYNDGSLNQEFYENISLMKNSRITIKEYSEKILLYFSEKQDHNEIEELISKTPNEYHKYMVNLDNNIPISLKLDSMIQYQEEIKKNISDIRSILRHYLKTEWDKAKEGK